MNILACMCFNMASIIIQHCNRFRFNPLSKKEELAQDNHEIIQIGETVKIALCCAEKKRCNVSYSCPSSEGKRVGEDIKNFITSPQY